MCCFDIAPGKNNPRNSEGAFIQAPGGDILFAYCAFTGDSAEDHAPADLKMIKSADEGRTWGSPVTLVRAQEHGAMNIMSLSLLPMANGDIGLFYLVRMSWLDMYIVLRRSSDGGRTWGEPTRCSTRPGYFVMNNDRAVRLASGRIILPAAEHKNYYDAQGRFHFVPADTVFFYSDDDGAAWHEAKSTLSLPEGLSRSGLQEPGVAELEKDCLFGWARTDLKKQYAFYSSDGGVTWDAPRPSRFSSPLSPLSQKRFTDGRLFAVWNPVPNKTESVRDPVTLGRTPLVYSFSGDNGKTWTPEKVLENSPDRGYCYTAVYQAGEHLLLAYCAGGKEDHGCLNRLRIRRIRMEEL